MTTATPPVTQGARPDAVAETPQASGRVVVEGLVKTYGTRLALRGADCRLDNGLIGLLGVALAVIGSVALFTGTKAAASSEAVTTEELAAQVADLQQQLKWTGDAVEQIADYLNELAGQSPTTGQAR